MSNYKRPIVCKDTGEQFMLYKDYLKSKHWINLKKRFKESKSGKYGCYVCSEKNNLHVHHKTYKRIGEEKIMDLLHLCSKCHEFAHLRLKESHSQKINLWSITKRMRKTYDSKQSNYSVKHYDVKNNPIPVATDPTRTELKLNQIEIVINNNIDHYIVKMKSENQEINLHLTNKEMLEVYRTFKEGRKRNKQKVQAK